MAYLMVWSPDENANSLTPAMYVVRRIIGMMNARYLKSSLMVYFSVLAGVPSGALSADFRMKKPARTVSAVKSNAHQIFK